VVPVEPIDRERGRCALAARTLRIDYPLRVPRTDRDEHRARILAVVDCIPKGRVASYGQIAREAGLPRHARLVGRVLKELPAQNRIAWHRVVNSAGKISLRPGAARQRERLAREGVLFTRSGRIDLARYRWTPANDEPERPR